MVILIRAKKALKMSLLLTDQQVQEFLINGYLILRPSSLDDDFHSTIFTEALTIYEKEGNLGNNILPRIPRLQQVFDDPVIKGGIQSLLGENYTMQPHRHPHLTSPGTKDQMWHKDSYFGFAKMLRHHQTRYLMAMYYPQDTTREMGPTGIKPRTQYDAINPKKYRGPKTFENTNAKNDPKIDMFATCTAGTVILIHYDLVHRGSANISSNSHRFMFKFQFNRLDEPTKPTWNHDPANANYDAADAGLLQPVVKHVWNWLLGNDKPIEQTYTVDDINRWKSLLDNPDGKVRLNANYNLALCNEYETLIERLYHEVEILRLEASYALTACRHNRDAIMKLQDVLRKEKNNESIAFCIAFIFFEMGPIASDALPLLINIVQKRDSWLLQQYCCEALGTIQSNDEDIQNQAVHCLIHILSKRDEQHNLIGKSHMRLTAALSLARLGPKAAQAIPELKQALYNDSNRYVNANALLALERIGTVEALKVAFDYLKMSRWCAKTTKDSSC